MRRIYRERKYICGNFMEVDVYPVYCFRKNNGRAKRYKPTTEMQQKLNHRHSVGALRRLLHTNFTESDWFLTLTFDNENLPESIKAGQRLLQNFLRRMKRHYTKIGLELKYIYAFEYGAENNRLHIHVVMNNGIAINEIEKIWGLGNVDAKKLDFDSNNGLSALAAYMLKSYETNNETWKKWSGSRNLKQPLVETKDMRVSHHEMSSLFDDGDCECISAPFDSYEIAGYSNTISKDIYDGIYFSAMFKLKEPTKNQDLPYMTGLEYMQYYF